MTVLTPGIRSLRKIQLKIETTPGTPLAATARLVGTLGMKQTQKLYRPADLETGVLASYERSYPVGVMAELPFDADANYEQIGYLLGMGLKGGVTGTGPTIFTYDYSPSLTTANTPDTYTIEYGDDVQAFRSAYCFARTIELSGSLDDVVKVKADIVGQQVATNAFTAAIAAPAALTPIIVGTGKLYVDTTWAGLGGTQLTETFIDFSWKHVSDGGTPFTPVKYGDGNLTYSQIAERKSHIELNITAAFNSTVAAYFAAFIASPQTYKYVRIKFTGPAISGGNDTLTLDGAYTIDTWDKLAEREGQDIVALKMVSMLDVTPTPDKTWACVLQNAQAALP